MISLEFDLVMDYAERGEILKWNSKTCRFKPYREDADYLSEQEIKRFLRHCIRGLHYSKLSSLANDTNLVHINNIVHRDIKPQNILLTTNRKAKLGDFGVSQLFERDDDDSLSKTEGTYHFMAPECCDRKNSSYFL